jgi:hypothetical protein
MTIVVEKKMAENKDDEKFVNASTYGCEVLLEKTTLQQTKDPSFPNDAYLIWYYYNGEEYLDLCRTAKKVSLFDMYYDKYGPGAVIKIDFGYGTVNPKMWGYKKPEKKKRK